MNKGQIPVPYIIALLLGIAVVAILGYWFFVLGGKIPGQATESWCKIKENTWCSEYSATDYSTEPTGGEWGDYAPGCVAIGFTKPDETACRTLLVGLKHLGESCTEDDECISGLCDPTAGTCA